MITAAIRSGYIAVDVATAGQVALQVDVTALGGAGALLHVPVSNGVPSAPAKSSAKPGVANGPSGGKRPSAAPASTRGKAASAGKAKDGALERQERQLQQEAIVSRLVTASKLDVAVLLRVLESLR